MATSSPAARDRYPHSLALDFPERRQGISSLASGQQVLEHAITYLVTEQTRQAESSQEAIVMLCQALGQLTENERRAPWQRAFYRW